MKMSERIAQRIANDPEYAKAALEVDFAQTVADIVVDARIRAGWTQKDLAERAELTQPQVSKLEAGVGNPQIGTVARAINALRAAVDVDTARIFDARHAAADTEVLVDATGYGLFGGEGLADGVETSATVQGGVGFRDIWQQGVAQGKKLDVSAANSNLAMAA